MNTKKSHQKPTLQDIAAIAGVSVSTVSHVMNGTAKISGSTKARVIDAANSLGYCPTNESSTRLLRQDRKIIGVIVQDIKNEFYAACAASVLSCADTAKYTVILYDCRHDRRREENFITEMIYQRASGLIIFGGANDDDLIELANQRGISVVLANRYMDGFSSVMFANSKSMRELIQRLYNAGRRKFLYLTETHNQVEQQSIQDRKDGFCLGMIDNQIPSTDYFVISDTRLQMNKVKMAKAVLEEYVSVHGMNFDTVLSCSDLITLGAMKYMSKLGYRIPEDIWVVGYDDITVAALAYPSLSTVHLDTDRLGEEAFLLLSEMLLSENYKPKQIMIENTIISRKSAPL